MNPANSTLVFTVRRKEPELVRPVRLTPSELKPLSYLDETCRYQQPAIMFYPAAAGMKGKNPAKVIKRALAEALVYYYPWAGRVREGPGRKLWVDCTAEGVVFVEADADARLEQFGEQPLLPPIPCIEELLYNKVASAEAVIGCPLLTLQVTHLLCGGFILAYSFSHVMSDASGIVQFLTCVAELARGSSAPSIVPVWQRELLNAHDAPSSRVISDTSPRAIIHDTTTAKADSHSNSMVFRTFFFGPNELTTLRRRLPEHLRSSSSFDLIIACIWRCRTIALQYKPYQQVCLAFTMDGRQKINPPLPTGYYGNAFAPTMAVSRAKEIFVNSLAYAVEQLKKAKAVVTEDYLRSIIGRAIQTGGWPVQYVAETYFITDISRAGLPNLDFGWGKPIYTGPTDNVLPPYLVSYFMSFKNNKGENGKMVTMCLQADAMRRFVNLLRSLLNLEDQSKM